MIKKFVFSLVLCVLCSINVANAVTTIEGKLNGQPVETLHQDPTSQPLDLYFHTHVDNTLTITQDTAKGDYTINVTAVSTPVVGQVVCLKENQRYYQGTVLSFTGSGPAYVLTLDTPLDYAFTIEGGCSLTSIDLCVDGSTTPVIFHISPPAGAVWHITRLIFHIEDATAMDDGTFGGGSALTRGLVVRKVNDTWWNLFNVKTNGEFALRAYDREYVEKPPAGTGHAMNVRKTWNGDDKSGVVIELVGSTGDDLQVVVQDSLLGQDVCNAIAQGHFATGE